MTGWDLAAWVAVGILGPGALIIFAAVLREVRTLLARPPRGDGAP